AHPAAGVRTRTRSADHRRQRLPRHGEGQRARGEPHRRRGARGDRGARHERHPDPALLRPAETGRDRLRPAGAGGDRQRPLIPRIRGRCDMCAIGAPGRSALLPSRALAGAAAAAAGAAPPRTALARGLPALRRLDHLAVDPAGARTRPAAAGALAPALLGSRALGGIRARGAAATLAAASATAAGAAAAPTTAALAATASTTAAGGLPTAARAVRTAQVLELLGLQALAGAGALGQRALRLAGD